MACRRQVRIDLIIEENVRFQNRENASLVHSSEEEGLVDLDVPCAEGGDDAFLCGRGAGCDDCCFEVALVARFVLFAFVFQVAELGELCEEVGEGTGGVRNCGARFFGFVKAVDSGVLVDILRAVVGDDAVKVEGDAEFLVVLVVFRGAGEDLSGGISLDIRLFDVRCVC